MKSAEESLRDVNSRGEWAEMRFMARAAEEGFHVSKPWGGSSRYDFAVEANGRFLRIQVKSTICRSGDGYPCSIQPPNTVSRRYKGDQVDFFAAYIIPEDIWYILPAKLVLHLATRIKLTPNRKNQKYERYKEAWHLLHEAVAIKEAKSVPDVDTSPKDNATPTEPLPDPAAQPAEIPVLRGAVEPSPSAGFDHDLLRSRLTGCFERMLKRR